MSCARATDRTDAPSRCVSSTICRFSEVLRFRRTATVLVIDASAILSSFTHLFHFVQTALTGRLRLNQALSFWWPAVIQA
jgi:hypothetical protein